MEVINGLVCKSSSAHFHEGRKVRGGHMHAFAKLTRVPAATFSQRPDLQ